MNKLNKKHLLLDLGSGNPEEGEIQKKGYILQDIKEFKNIDLVCDIEELNKYIKPEQCKEIRMSHVLEHFPTAKIVPLLKMLNTLIEPNGTIEIHVPNLKWHTALFLEEKDEEAINYMFGGQLDEYDFHKTGFTPHVLCKKLNEAGFSIKELMIERSIHALAIKNDKS